jgi:flagellar biosynthesis protein FlhF
MMRIKKFTGPNIAKSLALAKAEMGEDALILQTVRRRKGAESVVEIVAANNRAAESAGNLRAGHSGAKAGAGGPREGASAGARDGRAEVLPNMDLGIMRELKQVELQLNSIMTKIAPSAWDDRRKQLSELRVNLQNAGFDPGLVQRRFLKKEPLPGSSFEAYLEDLIGDVPLEVPEERVSVFVGPSGSGKTTALLKVAAAVLLSRGIKPRVIYFGSERTRDSKGLAASCRELGIKFKAVSDGNRLAKEIMKSGEHPVLIDTPGIAALGDESLEFIAELTRTVEGAVIRLVVNSAMDPANISAIASCIPRPARVSFVLTKLDEATRIGGAISAAIREGIPVAYVTGGRDFESGIFVPDRVLLYDRIVEGLAETGTGGN